MVPAIVATSFALAALPACGPIDLEAALALSVRGSDEVAIREAEVAAAQADEALARALRIAPSATATLVTGPAPEARGDITRSFQTNRSLTGIRPFGRVDIEVAQPLYTWGRLDAASDAAAAGVRAREHLLADAQTLVQLRVVQLYWGVSLARRLLAITADVEQALAEADRRVADALAAGEGEVLASDKYRVELFRGVFRSRKIDAGRALELARIGLAASLGLSPSALELKEAPLEPTEAPLPSEPATLASAERQRPDLLALEQGIAALDAEIRSEEAAAKPQFFVGAQFSYAYAPNRDMQLNPWARDDFNLLVAGGVIGFRQDLAFPMLGARAAKARAEKATLERQRAALARLVQVQVDSALADLRAASDKLAAARAALGSGRALFRSAGLDFSTGVTEARSLIEAYALYVESQVSAAQAAYDLEVTRARLGQVTGERPRADVQCQLR